MNRRIKKKIKKRCGFKNYKRYKLAECCLQEYFLFKDVFTEFNILESCSLVNGTKLSNKYGGKSVISRILPYD